MTYDYTIIHYLEYYIYIWMIIVYTYIIIYIWIIIYIYIITYEIIMDDVEFQP